MNAKSQVILTNNVTKVLIYSGMLPSSLHFGKLIIGAYLTLNVDNINVYPAANRCKFEGAMLVGDVASPHIPTGIAGHTIAKVVGEGRILRIVDDTGGGAEIPEDLLKDRAGRYYSQSM
ncbi:MAG: hypothetical protein C5S48_00360 [Candidatus Methanogaster sp.]|nr:MAG: hypothetical protein C5S48_00360 [ANME-2 cluster archaeon]